MRVLAIVVVAVGLLAAGCPLAVTIPEGCSFPPAVYTYHDFGSYNESIAPGGGFYLYAIDPISRTGPIIALPPGNSFGIDNFAPVGLGMFDVEITNLQTGSTLLLDRNQRDIKDPADSCIFDFIELNYGARQADATAVAQAKSALLKWMVEQGWGLPNLDSCSGLGPEDSGIQYASSAGPNHWFFLCSFVDQALYRVSNFPGAWVIAPCGNRAC